jgi:hypothetical protein
MTDSPSLNEMGSNFIKLGRLGFEEKELLASDLSPRGSVKAGL